MCSAKSVTVISSIPGLLKELKKVLPLVNFIQLDLHDFKDSSAVQTSEILLGDLDLLAPHFYNLPQTKWIQGTWAGVDKVFAYLKPDQRVNFTYTRLSGDNFGQLMGEYVLSNIVFHERNLFKVRENQKKKLWLRKECPSNHRSLNEITVGILGSGAIGSRIGKFLNAFGSTIFACGRRQSIDLNLDENHHISRYFPVDTQLPDFLKNLDYLVNVLPSTKETTNLLGRGILENCKENQTVFINVGRGSVIKESELVDALQKQWISGAILDVFEKEPLSTESPLWSMNNVFITPHVSGYSRPQDIARLFKKNFELYEKNLPLEFVADFSKGY